ncbi:MAG: cytochrome d ubiquinol oxidase subunit II [Prolixibacteraceae bacterium]|nr:cytochrome d ubiquinol oxidase subunit II [Prolixibacteraceae bacterium]
MTEINFAVLGISLLLYVLFGGADFGGGILELLTKGKASGIVSKAIAPVWEANHMWLILAVVILFVGFPVVYTTILTALHIPVLLVLLGIIFRGTAFTFRHYDIEEETPKAIYSLIFQYSSLFTTFFLGVLLGGIILGKINLDYNSGFYTVFISPWLNLFSICMGLFMVLLFAFLAGIFTISELKDDKHKAYFIKVAQRLVISLVAVGALVFATAEISGHPLFSEFYQSPISILSILLASVALPFLWINLNKNRPNLIRIIAGFQTTMILTGWFAIQFPVLVKINGSPDITFQNSGAPQQTQFYLFIALIVGIVVVFPAMAYLYKTFKFNAKNL